MPENIKSVPNKLSAECERCHKPVPLERLDFQRGSEELTIFRAQCHGSDFALEMRRQDAETYPRPPGLPESSQGNCR